MKIKTTLGLVGMVVLFSSAPLMAQTTSTSSIVRPRVSVEFENEVITLAKGFAEAFRSMPAGGKYMKISTSGGSRYLAGSIDSIKAIDGVLLIRMEKGLIHVISSRDIEMITNERPSDEDS